MNMTAMQNQRCKNAVHHFLLSWQSDEDPFPDVIFSSPRYCLESLGMKDNQYIAAIHRDKDNVHCHVSLTVFTLRRSLPKIFGRMQIPCRNVVASSNAIVAST
ncbi:relaxase/mobilization nuclease domain-containing protein [Nissabacter archeti]|uniref:Relaxase/mobilization nuclease domain-containing protein n=1 Tax=Nissabacter archeti TaxID=1917880 RepID=A0ABS5JLR7_9GAMM|nr:relaxase/mobilization nuclease domain-containing protein [Nissabacter archeti]